MIPTQPPCARRRLLAITAASIVALPRPGRAQRSISVHAERVALVIGNGAYAYLGTLRNPANDARAMAQTLARAGFALIGGAPQIDVDKATFEHLVAEFGRATTDAPVSLFYYSGHGLQVDGQNWLVPIDARVAVKSDITGQLVDTQSILLQMQGEKHRLGIVILDACRDNPLVKHLKGDSTPGLAAMKVAEGTIVSYSTFPGGVALDGSGNDSPFTTALVRAMNRPGLDVINLFNLVSVDVRKATGGQQIPWFSLTGIDGDFRFFPDRLAPPEKAPPPLRPPHPRPLRRPAGRGADMPW